MHAPPRFFGWRVVCGAFTLAILGWGIGCYGLVDALLADVSIMSESARVTDGHTRLGVVARQVGPIFDQSLALEMLTFTGEDVREGVQSLREKRPPKFPSARGGPGVGTRKR